ncbi:hypothetical protein LTR97_004666 [Elasticomyces elasticus]|uniref:AB hydrolase-1 domain-containing protein n=1 Tax=Elasticomyces elasticus TaxID=574655 RepID=A0AAN7ZUJ6_9PEZI|nr:hypothetical protein LTR97_004666 [Elasticomyces elasticus]
MSHELKVRRSPTLRHSDSEPSPLKNLNMKPSTILSTVALALPLARAQNETTDTWPEPRPGTFNITNFKFDSGETLDCLELYYQTIGTLKIEEDGSSNAVLLLHGSAVGNSEQFLNEEFAGTLFNPGQVLDTEKYFLVIPDGIGHGESSSPRNTGLHAKFPNYQYSDMIRANHQLLTEHLGINHTRLVLGVSMGGMHTWMWGEEYPDFSDALMPISSLPSQITAHNRLWRRMFIGLVQGDPAWLDGEYESQPIVGLTGALAVLEIMYEGQVALSRDYPTMEGIDGFYDATFEGVLSEIDHFDANNQIYAWNASYTYDPEARLAEIKVPLTAVNTADDLMNPPQLHILEDAVDNKMQKGLGRAVTIPVNNVTMTTGHRSYINAVLWKDELEFLLCKTASKPVERRSVAGRISFGN